jgi:hypothetical protein
LEAKTFRPSWSRLGYRDSSEGGVCRRRRAHVLPATTAHVGAWPHSDLATGSSQPEAPGANRLRAGCKHRAETRRGSGGPELAPMRPPSRRDPVRRDPATRSTLATWLLLVQGRSRVRTATPIARLPLRPQCRRLRRPESAQSGFRLGTIFDRLVPHERQCCFVAGAVTPRLLLGAFRGPKRKLRPRRPRPSRQPRLRGSRCLRPLRVPSACSPLRVYAAGQPGVLLSRSQPLARLRRPSKRGRHQPVAQRPGGMRPFRALQDWGRRLRGARPRTRSRPSGSSLAPPRPNRSHWGGYRSTGRGAVWLTRRGRCLLLLFVP